MQASFKLVSIQSEAGKLRLATDMAHIELIATQFCDLSDLSTCEEYKCLRSMRQLLFGTPNDILKDAGTTLPAVVALHLFLSSADGTIPMPYQVLGWSAPEYGRFPKLPFKCRHSVLMHCTHRPVAA